MHAKARRIDDDALETAFQQIVNSGIDAARASRDGWHVRKVGTGGDPSHQRAGGIGVDQANLRAGFLPVCAEAHGGRAFPAAALHGDKRDNFRWHVASLETVCRLWSS